MQRSRLFAATVAVALLIPAGQEVRAGAPAAAVILEWNQILQDTIPKPVGVLSPRYYAMMHIAMFDAVNAVQREFEPYRVAGHAAGSAEAAAAQAAHDVLVAVNPSAASVYDTALAERLGTRPSGFVRRGASLGASVAAEILAWRQNDGWIIASPVPYAEPPLPGRWQPTPPNHAPAAFTHLQHAAPMALLSSTQFLPPPPPSLTSERYAADFNEVKELGRVDSPTRTAEQTAVARLWAAAGVGGATDFFAVWQNVARDAARDRSLSLVETARLFALLNVSIHDALQTTQASKFVYGVWRPVTAIRGAADDLNPATDADAGWLPLLATPPYPSYSGNLSAIGASAARVLELALGTNDIPVAMTWRQAGGAPDVTRHFESFSQAAKEQFMSRIYGGIHFRFDQEAGEQAGRAAADFVFANYMTPR
jgi:hypothetical protein